MGSYTFDHLGRTISYTYDGSGNIATKADTKYSTTDKIEYFYDELNQLIRENDPYSNKTITYLYDAGGNIVQKKEYAYTKSDNLGTPTDTISYTYDAQWKDLLTSYDGKSITYDAIGNPINFMGSTLTWERGRKLSTMSLANGSTASYKYNADGIRTQKTVGGVTTDYFLEGSTIVAQKTGNDVIWYYFDGDGTRDAIEYDGDVYYYMYNPQGDVIGLFDENLNVVVEYTYDSWGNVSITGSRKDNLGKANPFRYRGYYYDEESGMYYLNSRYYHPEIGRFINADEVAGVNNDITAYNLFAYCGNNPICRIDISGNAWETVFDVASLCLSMAEVAANPQDALAWVGLAFDTLDLIPFVTGLGETAKALRLSKKGLESVGDAGKFLNDVPIVIGENMTRVRKYANQIGGKVYNPWNVQPWNKPLSLARNQRWINDMQKQGKTIIDIGPDFARRRTGYGASEFYEMERIQLKGYSNYYAVFRRSGIYGGLPGEW